MGVGFNLFETPLYVAQVFTQHGVAPWGLQFGARFALFGLGGHALFSGIFGAFLGLARQTGRPWVRVVAALIGLILAILAHALKNILPLIVTVLLRSAGEPLPGAGPPPQVPFLQAWLQSTITNLVVFLPFVILILVLLRQSGRWERRVIVGPDGPGRRRATRRAGEDEQPEVDEESKEPPAHDLEEVVAGPAMPSAAKPFFCWCSRTARSVPGPNWPSAAIPSPCWSFLTVSPDVPTLRRMSSWRPIWANVSGPAMPSTASLCSR